MLAAQLPAVKVKCLYFSGLGEKAMRPQYYHIKECLQLLRESHVPNGTPKYKTEILLLQTLTLTSRRTSNPAHSRISAVRNRQRPCFRICRDYATP